MVSLEHSSACSAWLCLDSAKIGHAQLFAEQLSELPMSWS
jgi:hypothetical protein